jgi:Uma2 family endonuclease
MLREKPHRFNDRWHSRTTACLGYLLGKWLDTQHRPHGELLGKGVGYGLSTDPDTVVMTDVAYISANVAAKNPDDTFMIDGVPTLAIEVLSPNDTTEEFTEKVEAYLAAGVPLVWIVHPRFRTVTVHRPDQEPESFNVQQELSSDLHLPGLRFRVEEIFTQ